MAMHAQRSDRPKKLVAKMKYPIVDTHAHLCDPVFDADLAEVLEKAQKTGICAILLVGETLADAAKNLNLARQYPILKPAAGLYPEILDDKAADGLMAFIRKHRRQLAAIGEVGLDHWVVKTASGKALQQKIFRRFIDLAAELDLPLNVHSRSAGKKAIALLLQCGATRVQMHAFDGRAAAAMPAVEAGYFFSIPPSVIRSRQKQKLVKRLPLSSLLLETDSPVLGPVANQRNRPDNITVAIDAIAEIKGVRKEAVIEAAAVNTQVLYGDAVMSTA
jgi:TatD DNase family protein